MKHKDIYEKLYLLQETYNAHTNITRINSKEDYYLRHIEDSIFLASLFPKDVRLIDVGTGAGYPGIPIAIERPDIQVYLNDSVGKKIKYLELVKKEVGLKNIEILPGRAEVLVKDKKYQHQFQAVTARAVAKLPELINYTHELLAPGGKLYFMKSAAIDQEIKSAEKTAKNNRLILEEIKAYQIGDLKRTIVIYMTKIELNRGDKLRC